MHLGQHLYLALVPTPAPVASVTAAPVTQVEAGNTCPVPTLSTTSLAKGEIPLSELWQQMLAALELPSARMLLSQQAELVRLDGQTGRGAGGDHLDGDGAEPSSPAGEGGGHDPGRAPASLFWRRPIPATMAVPAVPIAAQPLAESSNPIPSLKKQAWNGADPVLPIPNLKGGNTTRRSNTSRHQHSIRE